jgi:o-succinylbenzoate synthase
MALRNISVESYCLPLRRAWRSAAASFDTRRGFLVIVEDDSGQRGYGDCAPLAGTEAEGRARQWLAQQSAGLIGLSTDTALAKLPAPAHCPPAARCGLETALLDLISRQQRLPLYRWLEPQSSTTVRVNANLGSLDQAMHDPQAACRGATVVKLKVGLLPVSEDIDNLQRYARTLPAGISLRLDANRAWNPQQARLFISGVANLAVECLEEPIQDPSAKELTRLQRLAPFPLALDESLGHLSDEEIFSQQPVARLVFKPMLLGGPKAALSLARRARQAGLECLVTTTVDSAVGSWAAVHLAAAVDAGKGIMSHGLATSSWFKHDIATPPAIRDGRILLSENAGLGIQLRH